MAPSKLHVSSGCCRDQILYFDEALAPVDSAERLEPEAGSGVGEGGGRVVGGGFLSSFTEQ